MYLPHIQATACEMVISLMFAVPLSLFLALSMKYLPIVKKTLLPCFLILQNIPMFVLAPLLLSCFGWGFLSIIIPTVLMLAFPLTLSLIKGLDAVPKEYVAFYRLHGSRELKTLICIKLPFALPYFFSGLKIAAASSASGALAGEWAGAQKGIGVLMQIFRRQFDVEGVFICLGITVGLSLSFYLVAKAFEKLVLFIMYGGKSRLLLITLFALFLSGCHSAPKQSCRLLLDWFPNANHLPLLIGEKKGIFKKYGLDIELIILQDPPSTFSYLKTQKVDAALYYFPSFVKAFSKHLNCSLIGKLFDEPLYCLITKKAKSLHDLSSCSIGTYGDVFSKAVISALNQDNITFSQSFFSSCDLSHMLYFNQIDVASGSINVEAIQLEDKLGPLTVFSWKDLKIPKHPEIVVIANNNFLKNNPCFAKDFNQALQESIDFCKQHPKEVIECYFQAFPEKNRSRNWETLSILKTLELFTTTQEFNETQINDFLCWLKDTKALSSFLNMHLPLTALSLINQD